MLVRILTSKTVTIILVCLTVLLSQQIKSNSADTSRKIDTYISENNKMINTFEEHTDRHKRSSKEGAKKQDGRRVANNKGVRVNARDAISKRSENFNEGIDMDMGSSERSDKHVTKRYDTDGKIIRTHKVRKPGILNYDNGLTGISHIADRPSELDYTEKLDRILGNGVQDKNKNSVIGNAESTNPVNVDAKLTNLANYNTKSNLDVKSANDANFDAISTNPVHVDGISTDPVNVDAISTNPLNADVIDELADREYQAKLDGIVRKKLMQEYTKFDRNGIKMKTGDKDKIKVGTSSHLKDNQRNNLGEKVKTDEIKKVPDVKLNKPNVDSISTDPVNVNAISTNPVKVDAILTNPVNTDVIDELANREELEYQAKIDGIVKKKLMQENTSSHLKDNQRIKLSEKIKTDKIKNEPDVKSTKPNVDAVSTDPENVNAISTNPVKVDAISTNPVNLKDNQRDNLGEKIKTDKIKEKLDEVQNRQRRYEQEMTSRLISNDDTRKELLDLSVDNQLIKNKVAELAKEKVTENTVNKAVKEGIDKAMKKVENNVNKIIGGVVEEMNQQILDEKRKESHIKKNEQSHRDRGSKQDNNHKHSKDSDYSRQSRVYEQASLLSPDVVNKNKLKNKDEKYQVHARQKKGRHYVGYMPKNDNDENKPLTPIGSRQHVTDHETAHHRPPPLIERHRFGRLRNDLTSSESMDKMADKWIKEDEENNQNEYTRKTYITGDSGRHNRIHHKRQPVQENLHISNYATINRPNKHRDSGNFKEDTMPIGYSRDNQVEHRDYHTSGRLRADHQWLEHEKTQRDTLPGHQNYQSEAKHEGEKTEGATILGQNYRSEAMRSESVDNVKNKRTDGRLNSMKNQDSFVRKTHLVDRSNDHLRSQEDKISVAYDRDDPLGHEYYHISRRLRADSQWPAREQNQHDDIHRQNFRSEAMRREKVIGVDKVKQKSTNGRLNAMKKDSIVRKAHLVDRGNDHSSSQEDRISVGYNRDDPLGHGNYHNSGRLRADHQWPEHEKKQRDGLPGENLRNEPMQRENIDNVKDKRTDGRLNVLKNQDSFVQNIHLTNRGYDPLSSQEEKNQGDTKEKNQGDTIPGQNYRSVAMRRKNVNSVDKVTQKHIDGKLNVITNQDSFVQNTHLNDDRVHSEFLDDLSDVIPPPKAPVTARDGLPFHKGYKYDNIIRKEPNRHWLDEALDIFPSYEQLNSRNEEDNDFIDNLEDMMLPKATEIESLTPTQSQPMTTENQPTTIEDVDILTDISKVTTIETTMVPIINWLNTNISKADGNYKLSTYFIGRFLRFVSQSGSNKTGQREDKDLIRQLESIFFSNTVSRSNSSRTDLFMRRIEELFQGGFGFGGSGNNNRYLLKNETLETLLKFNRIMQHENADAGYFIEELLKFVSQSIRNKTGQRKNTDLLQHLKNGDASNINYRVNSSTIFMRSIEELLQRTFTVSGNDSEDFMKNRTLESLYELEKMDHENSDEGHLIEGLLRFLSKSVSNQTGQPEDKKLIHQLKHIFTSNTNHGHNSSGVDLFLKRIEGMFRGHGVDGGKGGTAGLQNRTLETLLELMQHKIAGTRYFIDGLLQFLSQSVSNEIGQPEDKKLDHQLEHMTSNINLSRVDLFIRRIEEIFRKHGSEGSGNKNGGLHNRTLETLLKLMDHKKPDAAYIIEGLLKFISESVSNETGQLIHHIKNIFTSNIFLKSNSSRVDLFMRRIEELFKGHGVGSGNGNTGLQNRTLETLLKLMDHKNSDAGYIIASLLKFISESVSNETGQDKKLIHHLKNIFTSNIFHKSNSSRVDLFMRRIEELFKGHGVGSGNGNTGLQNRTLETLVKLMQHKNADAEYFIQGLLQFLSESVSNETGQPEDKKLIHHLKNIFASNIFHRSNSSRVDLFMRRIEELFKGHGVDGEKRNTGLQNRTLETLLKLMDHKNSDAGYIIEGLLQFISESFINETGQHEDKKLIHHLRNVFASDIFHKSNSSRVDLFMRRIEELFKGHGVGSGNGNTGLQNRTLETLVKLMQHKNADAEYFIQGLLQFLSESVNNEKGQPEDKQLVHQLEHILTSKISHSRIDLLMRCIEELFKEHGVSGSGNDSTGLQTRTLETLEKLLKYEDADNGYFIEGLLQFASQSIRNKTAEPKNNKEFQNIFVSNINNKNNSSRINSLIGRIEELFQANFSVSGSRHYNTDLENRTLETLLKLNRIMQEEKAYGSYFIDGLLRFLSQSIRNETVEQADKELIHQLENIFVSNIINRSNSTKIDWFMGRIGELFKGTSKVSNIRLLKNRTLPTLHKVDRTFQYANVYTVSTPLSVLKKPSVAAEEENGMNSAGQSTTLPNLLATNNWLDHLITGLSLENPSVYTYRILDHLDGLYSVTKHSDVEDNRNHELVKQVIAVFAPNSTEQYRNKSLSGPPHITRSHQPTTKHADAPEIILTTVKPVSTKIIDVFDQYTIKQPETMRAYSEIIPPTPTHLEENIDAEWSNHFAEYIKNVGDTQGRNKENVETLNKIKDLLYDTNVSLGILALKPRLNTTTDVDFISTENMADQTERKATTEQPKLASEEAIFPQNLKYKTTEPMEPKITGDFSNDGMETFETPEMTVKSQESVVSIIGHHPLKSTMWHQEGTEATKQKPVPSQQTQLKQPSGQEWYNQFSKSVANIGSNKNKDDLKTLSKLNDLLQNTDRALDRDRLNHPIHTITSEVISNEYITEKNEHELLTREPIVPEFANDISGGKATTAKTIKTQAFSSELMAQNIGTTRSPHLITNPGFISIPQTKRPVSTNKNEVFDRYSTQSESEFVHTSYNTMISSPSTTLEKSIDQEWGNQFAESLANIGRSQERVHEKQDLETLSKLSDLLQDTDLPLDQDTQNHPLYTTTPVVSGGNTAENLEPKAPTTELISKIFAEDISSQNNNVKVTITAPMSTHSVITGGWANDVSETSASPHLMITNHKSTSLSQTVGVTDQTLQEITTRPVGVTDQTLQEITIRPVGVTDQTLQEITIRPVDVTDQTLQEITTRPIGVTEQTLQVISTRPIGVTDQTLQEITTRPVGVTDQTLQEITTRPVGVTDQTLQEITTRPVGVTYQTLQEITTRPVGVTDQTLQEITIRPVGVTDQTLQEITRPVGVTDQTLQEITTRPVGVTYQTLQEITTRPVGVTYQTLQEITTRPVGVTDQTLQEITTRPVGVTDQTLQEITTRPVGVTYQTLQEITTRPVGVTDQTLQEITTSRPATRPVDVTDQTLQEITTRPVGVTDQTLQEITTRHLKQTEIMLNTKEPAPTSKNEVFDQYITQSDFVNTERYEQTITSQSRILKEPIYQERGNQFAESLANIERSQERGHNKQDLETLSKLSDLLQNTDRPLDQDKVHNPVYITTQVGVVLDGNTAEKIEPKASSTEPISTIFAVATSSQKPKVKATTTKPITTQSVITSEWSNDVSDTTEPPNLITNLGFTSESRTVGVIDQTLQEIIINSDLEENEIISNSKEPTNEKTMFVTEKYNIQTVSPSKPLEEPTDQGWSNNVVEFLADDRIQNQQLSHDSDLETLSKLNDLLQNTDRPRDEVGPVEQQILTTSVGVLSSENLKSISSQFLVTRDWSNNVKKTEAPPNLRTTNFGSISQTVSAIDHTKDNTVNENTKQTTSKRHKKKGKGLVGNISELFAEQEAPDAKLVTTKVKDDTKTEAKHGQKIDHLVPESHFDELKSSTPTFSAAAGVTFNPETVEPKFDISQKDIITSWLPTDMNIITTVQAVGGDAGVESVVTDSVNVGKNIETDLQAISTTTTSQFAEILAPSFQPPPLQTLPENVDVNFHLNGENYVAGYTSRFEPTAMSQTVNNVNLDKNVIQNKNSFLDIISDLSQDKKHIQSSSSATTLSTLRHSSDRPNGELIRPINNNESNDLQSPNNLESVTRSSSLPIHHPMSSRPRNDGVTPSMPGEGSLYHENKPVKYEEKIRDYKSGFFDGFRMAIHSSINMRKHKKADPEYVRSKKLLTKLQRQPGYDEKNEPPVNVVIKNTIINHAGVAKNVEKQEHKDGENRKDDHIVSPLSAFGEWEEWSKCTLSCGSGGHMTRQRSCRLPVPCPGRTTDTRPCNFQPICEVIATWGAWSSWSTCSTTCGLGFADRRRSCLDSSGIIQELCNGKDTDSRECFLTSCKSIIATWGAWTSWSTCSTTCGLGFADRRRSCLDSSGIIIQESCNGKDTDSRKCFLTSCKSIIATWGAWASWSTCSTTCGLGFADRRRSCLDSSGIIQESCNGKDTNSRKCFLTSCKSIIATWGAWTSWSTCSTTCGLGFVDRRRSCLDSSGIIIQGSCNGKDTDSRKCFLTSCKSIIATWGAWTSWSTCSTTCGLGFADRRRSCLDSSGIIIQESCNGKDTDSRKCFLTSCKSNSLTTLGGFLIAAPFVGFSILAVMVIVSKYCSKRKLELIPTRSRNRQYPIERKHKSYENHGDSPDSVLDSQRIQTQKIVKKQTGPDKTASMGRYKDDGMINRPLNRKLQTTSTRNMHFGRSQHESKEGLGANMKPRIRQNNSNFRRPKAMKIYKTDNIYENYGFQVEYEQKSHNDISKRSLKMNKEHCPQNIQEEVTYSKFRPDSESLSVSRENQNKTITPLKTREDGAKIEIISRQLDKNTIVEAHHRGSKDSKEEGSYTRSKEAEIGHHSCPSLHRSTSENVVSSAPRMSLSNFEHASLPTSSTISRQEPHLMYNDAERTPQQENGVKEMDIKKSISRFDNSQSLFQKNGRSDKSGSPVDTLTQKQSYQLNGGTNSQFQLSEKLMVRKQTFPDSPSHIELASDKPDPKRLTDDRYRPFRQKNESDKVPFRREDESDKVVTKLISNIQSDVTFLSTDKNHVMKYFDLNSDLSSEASSGNEYFYSVPSSCHSLSELAE